MSRFPRMMRQSTQLSLSHTHILTKESFILSSPTIIIIIITLLLLTQCGPHTLPYFHPIKNIHVINLSVSVCLSITLGGQSIHVLLCFPLTDHGTQLIKCNHVALHSTVRLAQDLSHPKGLLSFFLT